MSSGEIVLDPKAVEKKWAEMAPLIDVMMTRVGTRDEFPVEPGSSLAGDDRASDPYRVSYVVMQGLTAGVDHMHAVKTLVVDQQVLHLAAPSSLSRGALENLATAYWVLSPSRRKDRVERALRWHYKNYDDQHKALDVRGLSIATREEHFAKVDRVALQNGLDPKSLRRGYFSTTVVKYCEEQLPDEVPEGILFPWQLCSGFAHGRPWAYLGASKREVVGDDGNGVANVRLTSDLSIALFPLLAAMHLLEALLRPHRQRGRRP